MKKKHRKIVVDGSSYGYTVCPWGEGVTIYQDKRPIRYYHCGGDSTITPKFVSQIITEKMGRNLLEKHA